MLVRQFSIRCFPVTLAYFRATWTTKPTGNQVSSYPGTGVAIRANVQPRSVRREEPGGVITAMIVYDVFIRMADYQAIASPGVAVDDRFAWGSRMLGSLGPMRDRGGLGVTAWVECKEINI